MITYIIYSDVSGSDTFEIFHVGSDRATAINAFKKELPGFLSYGPDDATSLRLVKADLSPNDIKLVTDEFNKPTNNDEVLTLLDSLWYELSHEEIFCETGCEQLIQFYCEQNGLDPYDPDSFDIANKALTNNEVLQQQLIKDYIAQNY